jgi:hypothetical protein
MMNKRISAVLLTLLIIFTLTGCQLAREDGTAEKSQDKLIGVYVSYDYIDLFDFESYMNDNLKISGGELKIDGESRKYEGRMYAVQKDEVKTASQGEKYTNTEFVFEEVEGIGMFSPTITDPLNNDLTYISFSGDEGFTDVQTHVIGGNNEDGIELEGTLYISSGAMSKALYINPVYQSADGRVYLVTGQGFVATGDNGEGGVYTQTLTDKVTVKENGKSKSYSSSVKISLATMYPTEKVTILQMDKDSNILKKDEYKPEDVPNELKAESTADYIIVESTKTTYDKQMKIERTIFSKSDQTLWFFCKGDDKVLIKAYTTILWNQPTK